MKTIFLLLVVKFFIAQIEAITSIAFMNDVPGAEHTNVLPLA